MEIKISYDKLDNPNNREPHFLMYSLIEDDLIYPFDLTDEWKYFLKQGSKYIVENYLILTMCDKMTYNNCYCRLFNPVEIRIIKLENCKTFKDTTIGLCTIDDGYYGCNFKNLSSDEFNVIFAKVNDFVLENTFLNSDKFIELLKSLGGEDVSY